MRFLAYFLLSVTLFSCSTKKTAVDTSKSDPSSEAAALQCLDIILSKDAGDMSELKEATIISHEMMGECLSISYQYSGCQEALPKLIWNGVATRSLPPQINLQLYVTDSGMCDMLLEDNASFDLSTLGMTSDEIVIYLNGDNENKLLYKQ